MRCLHLVAPPFFLRPAPSNPRGSSKLWVRGRTQWSRGFFRRWRWCLKQRGRAWGSFWWVMSSPFLLMAVLCGWAVLPIIAHSLVWSTEVTRVKEEVDEEAVMDGWRTSISSWAENLRRRLWMQAWETADSDWVKVANEGEWEGQKDKT